MAAFHLIIYGRFWVITEDFAYLIAFRPALSSSAPLQEHPRSEPTDSIRALADSPGTRPHWCIRPNRTQRHWEGGSSAARRPRPSSRPDAAPESALGGIRQRTAQHELGGDDAPAHRDHLAELAARPLEGCAENPAGRPAKSKSTGFLRPVAHVTFTTKGRQSLSDLFS